MFRSGAYVQVYTFHDTAMVASFFHAWKLAASAVHSVQIKTIACGLHKNAVSMPRATENDLSPSTPRASLTSHAIQHRFNIGRRDASQQASRCNSHSHLSPLPTTHTKPSTEAFAFSAPHSHTRPTVSHWRPR